LLLVVLSVFSFSQVYGWGERFQDLVDVDKTAPTDGQVPTWDDTTNLIIWGSPSATNDSHSHTSLTVKQYNQTISKTIYNITTSTDFLMPGVFPVTANITKVSLYCTGGTSVVGMLKEYSSAGVYQADVNSVNWTATADTVVTFTNFSNNQIDAGDCVSWDTVTATGNPPFYTFTIQWTGQ
jgi:hypothetical protein